MTSTCYLDYLEAGAGPELLVIPPADGHPEIQRPLLRAFSRYFHTFVVRHRGEIDDPCSLDPYTYDQLISDLHQFVRRQCSTLPILCGISFGGPVMLHYALSHPGEVGGLVSVCGFARYDFMFSGVRAVFDRLARTRSAARTTVSLMRLGSIPMALYEICVARPPRPLWRGLQADVRRWAPPSSTMYHRLQLIRQVDLIEQLSKIQAPVLAVAYKQDRLVSPRHARVLVQKLPRAELCLLGRGGHFAPYFRPDELAERIYAWARGIVSASSVKPAMDQGRL